MSLILINGKLAINPAKVMVLEFDSELSTIRLNGEYCSSGTKIILEDNRVIYAYKLTPEEIIAKLSQDKKECE